MDSEKRVDREFLSEPRSEVKVLLGQKRGICEIEETSEKRVKLRDLESVIRSESQTRREGTNTAHSNENANLRTLDLNVGSVNGASGDEKEMDHKNNLAKSRGFDLDLNAEDPFYPYKNYDNLKSRDEFECESSVGPLEEKGPMSVWKGLKQNNFMSNLHGSAPMAIPKPRGRKKNNNDAMKRKIEMGKKEQVDRFARIAAPSGLLNGLNPGIINHVRNSRQVHSIIEALVKSENDEKISSGNNQVNQFKNGSRLGHGDTLLGKRQMSDYPFFSKSIYLKDDVSKGNGDPYLKENGNFSGIALKYYGDSEKDRLALNMKSSLLAASENVSCLLNEESGNFSSVDSHSVKAANVASQWLELLSQDIKGRLAALRRSKKRVQAVITTELPSLISREFSSHTSKATVDAHNNKWATIFGQMDKGLSEEETYLESWLNQVKEMQLHCESGLHRSNLLPAPQLMGLGNANRPGEANKSDNDLAVKAAAASIYSTCYLLASMENSPCY